MVSALLRALFPSTPDVKTPGVNADMNAPGGAEGDGGALAQDASEATARLWLRDAIWSAVLCGDAGDGGNDTGGEGAALALGRALDAMIKLDASLAKFDLRLEAASGDTAGGSATASAAGAGEASVALLGHTLAKDSRLALGCLARRCLSPLGPIRDGPTGSGGLGALSASLAAVGALPPPDAALRLFFSRVETGALPRWALRAMAASEPPTVRKKSSLAAVQAAAEAAKGEAAAARAEAALFTARAIALCVAPLRDVSADGPKPGLGALAALVEENPAAGEGVRLLLAAEAQMVRSGLWSGRSLAATGSLAPLLCLGCPMVTGAALTQRRL